MDDLNKQNLNPSQPFIGTGEGEVPLATPAQMPDLMRTALSDVKTLQETGGQNVKSYIPETVSPASFEPKNDPTVTAKPAEQMFQPPQPQNATMASEINAVPAKQHQKGLVSALIAFLVIIALGAAGYFFVYPKFFASPEENPIINEPITPISENPEMPLEPLVPIVLPATTTEENAATSTDSSETKTFISLLQKPADSSQEKILTGLDATNVKNTVVDLATGTAATKEIILKKEDGSPFSFGEIMATILPTVFTSETISQFEDYQYSVIAFSNSQGVWLNYIGKAKADADLAALKNKINLIEAANLANTFLKTSGDQQGEWKSGTNNRYLSFSQNGNALNYGWFDDKLLITTSYPAWQAISPKIQ
ncbi:MAG: hypothetical protein Q8O49_01485 [bacterium]|nr:hypothetical protein [bacterium]